jgi:hypothetical protein
MLARILALIALGTAVAGDDDPARRAGPDWWSLQPVSNPSVPAAGVRDRATDPIDSFVRARLDAAGLRPAPAADRATLIRRATFDLIGLPPTPEQVDVFVRDPAPDAFERLIDRLLASPHYGERWARHWLDSVRFAESQGFERDIVRDHAWRYRDYVIRSFNDDKPYDQFVREQVAGDVLDGAAQDSIVATGFLVAGPYDEAGNGSASALLRAQIREEELEDMIGTLGQTFLGLTVQCGRCHDHKFDPIPQRDYYRLKAALDGVRHGNRSVLPSHDQRVHEGRVAAWTAEISALEAQLARLDDLGRGRVLAGQPTSPLPETRPLALWTFELDARDSVGGLHGTLMDGATIARGRLRLDGKRAYVQTTPLTRDLRAKTLEAWLTLADLKQRGGGALTVQTRDGHTFDSIVFGEREPRKWIAGSNSFQRTCDLAADLEDTPPTELVHIAVVYASDSSIVVYRNGKRYAPAYVPSGPDAAQRTYSAGNSHVLLGLRHTGAANGFLAGEIEEARLYDRTLDDAQIAASFRSGPRIVRPDEIDRAFTAPERAERDRCRAELDRVRERLQRLPPLPMSYAANPREPEPTAVLLRGDVQSRGETVTAGGLSALAGLAADFGIPGDAPEATRRRKLADWLTDPANPLTARVMVNRVWHYHFGRGLVGTPNDFGYNGDRPSHPELLDWLAREFVAGGWSLKQLHRRIMRSSPYRQSSRYEPRGAALDSDNRLLWRYAPRRLEGEAIRDAMLAVSGELNPAVGGPSFRPFQLTVFNSHFYTLVDSDAPEFNRRTVYRIHVNSAKDPLLESLDCPDPSTRTPRRSITTTPLQALGLMNSGFVQRQAQRLAARVKSECGAAPAGQIDRAYRLTLGRPPLDREAIDANTLAQTHGLEHVCWVLLNTSEFLYVR